MPGAYNASSALDKALLQHEMAMEPLLPTPTNINPMHLPRGDLLQFIGVQQQVMRHLDINLPLLNGMFVLVPSGQLKQQQQQQQQQQQPSSNLGQSKVTVCHHSSAAGSAHAMIPWRLRQVSCVEVSADSDPADATVQLVGGDRVAAGEVKQGLLTEAEEYQYLCCELAHMQRSGQMCQLQVLDVAHITWRLQVACDLDDAMQAWNREQAEATASNGNATSLEQSSAVLCKVMSELLVKLPPHDWIREQILHYVELNPIVWPDSPDQPWQLLSDTRYNELLDDAAAAWPYFLQQKLAGHQLQPVTEYVPWLPVATDAMGQACSQGARQAGMGDQQCLQSAWSSGREDSYCTPEAGKPAVHTVDKHHDGCSQRDKRRNRPYSGHDTAAMFAHQVEGSEQHQSGLSNPSAVARSNSTSRITTTTTTTSSRSQSSIGTTTTTGSSSDRRSSSVGTASPSTHLYSTYRRARQFVVSGTKAGAKDYVRSCSTWHRHSRPTSMDRIPRHASLRPGSRSRIRSRSRNRNHSRSRSRRRSRSRNRRSRSLLCCHSGDREYCGLQHAIGRRSSSRSRSRTHSRSRSAVARCSRSRSSSPLGMTSARGRCPSSNRATDSVRNTPNGQHFASKQPQFDAKDPWCQYVELKAQQWLKELAVKFSKQSAAQAVADGRASQSSNKESPQCNADAAVSADAVSGVYGWTLDMLQDQHPLPDVVLQRYTKRTCFISCRPELQWVPPMDSCLQNGAPVVDGVHARDQEQQQFCFAPKHFEQLLAAARTTYQQRSVHLATVSQPEDSKRDWPLYLQPQQERLQEAAAATTAAAMLSARFAATSAMQDLVCDLPQLAAQNQHSINSSTYQPHPIYSRYRAAVEPEVQAWLQRLAVYLGPAAAAGAAAPASIKLITVKHKMPLPAPVLQSYGTVEAFVTARPELGWVGQQSYTVYLRHTYHVKLLEAAAAAGNVPAAASGQHHQQQDQQPGEATGAAASAVGPGADYASYMRQRWCRERLGMQHYAEYAAFIDEKLQNWLLDLAVQLKPVRRGSQRPTSIKLAILKHVLPVPCVLVRHFGSVVSFVEAVPELEWAERETSSSHRNYICLVPQHHSRLLQAAASRDRRFR